MVKLEEIVGQGKPEEELEGGVIAGPSEEAVGSSSSGNTLFFFLKSNYLFSHTVSLLHEFSLFLSKTDPSDQNICLTNLI